MARKIVRGQGSPKGKKVANKTGSKKAAAEKLIKELQQQGEDDNAPQGLDELIKSIQKEVDDKEEKEKEEKKKMSALVKVITESGDKKEEKVEQEDIDPEVLELLGIEDYEVEMDYEQFRTLLKEFLSVNQEGSLIKGGKEFSVDQVEKVRDTYKKSKGKKGKFTPKKKKTVTASGFKGENKGTSDQAAQVVDKGSLIPNPEQKGSEDLNDEEKIEEIKAEIDEKVKEQLVPLSKTLSEIEKNLEKILETNKDKLDLEKQAARDAAKKEETEGFKDKEAKLEGKEKEAKVKSEAVDKLKPVSSIFDMIGNFFKNVLMGGALLGLIDFITDPGKAFKGITDFLNSTLIPFINDIIKFYNDIILAPTNWIIDGINAGFNELEYAMKQIQKVIPIPDITFPDIPNIKVPDVPNIPDGFGLFQKQEGGGEVINLNLPSRSLQRQSTGGGVLNINLPNQPLQQQTQGGSVVNANDLSLFDGGAIDGRSGLTITGMGKDTQLIAAQPGEVMMSKKAVDMYGADNLLAANEMAGGSNKPKFGKIAGFQNGGQVGRVVIGAGHAPTVENAARGIMLGSDGRSVQGTADDGSSGRNTPGNATGVREWEATKHVVDTLKRLVQERGLTDKIGFQDIYSWKGLKGVPRSVEGTKGQQYVDLHFDARGFGRAGVLPSANESATDRSLMSIFGRHNENFDPSSKGVTAGGGTLLELGAIDDPAIRSLLQEVKKGEQGPASMEIAEKILRGILPSIQGAPVQQQTPQVDLSLSDVDDLSGAPPAPILPPPPGAQLGRTKVEVTQISPPVIQSGDGTTVLPVPTGGQSQTSAASAAQGRVPGFSAEDGSNFDLIVVKSIYNIVG
jgi:hypothetical protein